MRTQRWGHRALAVAITALVFGVFAPTFSAPVGATAASAVTRSSARARSASNKGLVTNVTATKKKKKKATGLMAKLRHYAVILIVLAAVVFAVFLIASGARGPRGRARQRARQ